jgi:uncharacterized tellurite resistance protein B-like protein
MAGYYLYISMKQKKESNPLNIRKVGLLDKISLFGGDFEYWHCPSCQGKIIISKVGDHECPFCNNSITLLNCSECQEENLLITGSKVSCGSCDYIFNSKKISKQKKKIKEPKKESQMSNTEKLYNEFPHISEEPKEFNFGSMVGYAMMMLSISWDDDGDQDELQVIFKKVLTMFGVPVRMNGDQANEIWNELRLWYNALTDLPNHGKDEKYKIVEWIIESVKNPTGKIEDDIADMILQETADPTKLADKDWAPSYMLQALIDVANANNEITDKEMSFLLWCANRLGYDMFDNFDNLTFSKSSEEKSEPEHSEDETSDSSSLNVLDMSGSSAVQDLLAKVQAIVDADPDEEEAYGVLPSHWENKQIICCLLRHMLVIDDQVHDNERASMSQTVQKFTSEGIDLSGSWDDVDDYMVSLHGQDYNKFEQTVIDCEDYVNEHFEDDQKFAVLSAIMNMAAADRVLEDSELKMLKRIAEKWSVNYESMVDAMKASGAKMNTSEESDPMEKQETQKEEPSVADSSAETPTEPVESSDNPIESFREFMTGEFPGMKLPKNKNYGQCDISSGMLICFMAKKSSVSTYLYSSGKLPAKKVFEKINSLGLSGKVINDKYTLTPMTGSRNPNVVRIDIEIKYDGRDLNSAEMRAEVKDVYGQLLELCKPLA